MKQPSLVRRLAVPIVILVLAGLYILFSTNVGEWVRSLEGNPLTNVFFVR